MPGLAWQFAGSLASVVLLVVLVRRLGLGGDARLGSEREARQMAQHAMGGFTAVAVALDRRGRAALLRDAGGRILLLAAHGAHFVTRELDWTADAAAAEGRLAIKSGGRRAISVVLDLGEAACDWAVAIGGLGQPR